MLSGNSSSALHVDEIESVNKLNLMSEGQSCISIQLAYLQRACGKDEIMGP